MDHQSSNSQLPDIVQKAQLHAPIQKVWAAVATSEGLASWFMPNDMEPVLGREFHLEAGPFGRPQCKITEVEPTERLSFNWGKDWTLTFEVMEQGGGTAFTLIHSGWVSGGATEFGQAHSEVAKGWPADGQVS
ncbi:hypothetical protein PAECIP111893_02988 [Paenibacillus plantiphilus]|uniref:Activator of Hsp90 ATPase homologue 1/2-like C-terminal domain-containing protein n=1 Tax=Paenibacillus plantiphilus TaxID=2905650 RepID=A0ABN8GJ53_9BACL|nr:hypothetical protein PAECIP111893_02988 [Paenibacillus plantiphilus]